MKTRMAKDFFIVALVAIAFPAIFASGVSAKVKKDIPSPRDDSVYSFGGVEKINGVPVYQVEVDKWAISFIFSAPYVAGADSVSIHHFSGEPYPLEWIPSTTRKSKLTGKKTFVVFERDWDHDITRMLWYAGYELGFAVGLFKDGKVVWGKDIIVVANCEGVKIPEPNSQPTGVIPFTTAVTPEKFDLSQNFPNPFNPTTTIEYALPKASEVVLTVYNSVGQVVATLFNGRQEAGSHQVTWDALQNSAGTYFLELRTSEFRKVIKMNLIR